MRATQKADSPDAAAKPANAVKSWRRVTFMARLAPKNGFRQGAGWPRKYRFRATFLDLADFREFNRATHRKDVLFDPPTGPEAGGQRPTALCALGRESVWNIFSLAPLAGRGENDKASSGGAAKAASRMGPRQDNRPSGRGLAPAPRGEVT